MQLFSTPAIAQPTAVIPAKAGIQLSAGAGGDVDLRLRGDDTEGDAGIGGALTVGGVKP
jgi:hypothetical protein